MAIKPTLIRDLVPAMMRSAGNRPIVIKAGPELTWIHIDKIKQESSELIATLDRFRRGVATRDDVLDEMADLREAMAAAAARIGIVEPEAAGRQMRRRARHGGFDEGLIFCGFERDGQDIKGNNHDDDGDRPGALLHRDAGGPVSQAETP